jgi:hypothetical protein
VTLATGAGPCQALPSEILAKADHDHHQQPNPT